MLQSTYLVASVHVVTTLKSGSTDLLLEKQPTTCGASFLKNKEPKQFHKSFTNLNSSDQTPIDLGYYLPNYQDSNQT